MKLKLNNKDSQISLELRIDQAEYNEIWIVESLKTIWEIWTRMGWCSTRSSTIKEEDWKSFRPGAMKQKIINDISHFNSLTQRAGFDIEADFDEGWMHILQIVSFIHQEGIMFESSPEVDIFRQTVIRFGLFGLNRGLDRTRAGFNDFLIFSVRNELTSSPVIYLHDFEIDFITNETEATVTIKSDSWTEGLDSQYESTL